MKTYKIGDVGPNNGIVFMVSEDGTNGVEAQREYQPDMSWNDAMVYGENGWRLPTKDELNEMYLHKDVIGGFAIYNYYWSSSEAGADKAWAQYFFSGYGDTDNKVIKLHVRLVKEF